MNKIKNIDALILTGGKSSRMNFLDKALLKYDNNRTFLEKITDDLENFENIMVSVNKNQNFLIPRGTIVTDSSENLGPIEGIYQGLLNSKSDFIFVTTCDMPNITKELLNFILQFTSHDYDAIIVKDKKGKTYPLFGLYNKSSLSTIERFIMDKNYRLQDVLAELNVKYISLENTDFNPQILLKSIDTEEELNFNYIFRDCTPFIAVCGAKITDQSNLIDQLVKHFKDANYKVEVIKSNSECNLNILEKKEFDIILLQGFENEPFPKIEILKKDVSLSPSANPTNLLFYVSDSSEILENSSMKSISLKDTISIFKEILKVANL
ncbi:MAG: NTP transferase domain-containing protein [Cetobacterium sp.]